MIKDSPLTSYKVGKEKKYVHFYKASEKNAFAISSIFETKQRPVRILENNEFRETNLIENYVYNYLFSKKYDVIMKKFREATYYGSYILRGGDDKKFLSQKEKDFFRIIDNSNPRNKGIVCDTDSSGHIIKIVNHLSDETLKRKIKKPELCLMLLKLFKEKNLLFESF